MKNVFTAFTLTLLLAACGGTGPTPTPPTEPTPPTTPVDPITPPTEPITPVPVPPVNPEPTPPTSDVPYYGEWEVTFTADSGVGFVHSLNITDPLSNEFVENGGSGLQRLCIGDGSNPCDEESDFPSGFGFIGNLKLDDGTTPLSLSITTLYDASEEPELKIFSIEELTQSTNSQGQQVLEGDAIWLYTANTSDDGTTGTITAVNVGPPELLEPISGFSVKQAVIEHREHLTR